MHASRDRRRDRPLWGRLASQAAGESRLAGSLFRPVRPALPARPATDPLRSTARETLICFALLRQMETPCPVLQNAYQRLVEAASRADGMEAGMLVLGWVEGEVRALRTQGGATGEQEGQLLQAAVALASVLRQ